MVKRKTLNNQTMMSQLTAINIADKTTAKKLNTNMMLLFMF